MNNKEAKEHLLAVIGSVGVVDKDSLQCGGWHLYAKSGERDATLDGEFDADDLEAISRWMRDPNGVISS